MPLKRREDKKRGNGAKKYQTNIINNTINKFKKYNPEKVTLQGVIDFAQDVFYQVGYEIEVQVVALARKFAVKATYLFAKVAEVMKDVKVFFNRFLDTILDDLGEPFDKFEEACYNIAQIFAQARKDKDRKASKEILDYIKQGLTKHKSQVEIIRNYALPFFSILLFVGVVNNGLNRYYAIDVVLDGQNIGTISNYNILESADAIIKNKLISTENQSWSLNSSIKMIPASQNGEYLDERQLADNILQASNEDIVEGTGLYVDGTFYGAVENASVLRNELENLLEPYKTEDENTQVSFVQNVSVASGIFFTESMVNENELVEMVSGEVSGEKKYTVIKGDSPSLIAQKNGITLKQLYNLNPDLEGGGLWVGDELLVGASVPFLRVRTIERATRSVEVPYTTKIEKNNSLSLGTNKVSTAGVKGINEQLVETEYIDGIYNGETIISTTVISEPVTEVIQQGTLYNGQVFEGGSGRIMWPTAAGRVSRGFAGQYPAHNGLDIAAPTGTAIFAADSGVVTTVVYSNRGYGIYAIIEHGGYQTLYAHTSALNVSVGQQVTKGQVIGRVGNTGNSTGPHLHFEVKKGNVRYNPYNYF